MPDAIPEDEKSRRLAVLNERQRKIQTARYENLVGRTFEVLTDRHHPARGVWGGRSSCNKLVNFSTTRESLRGQYVQVKISRASANALFGEHVE
jgi:tRNA-2-methylthio-N6-dimethylallyladenosine synthase